MYSSMKYFTLAICFTCIFKAYGTVSFNKIQGKIEQQYCTESSCDIYTHHTESREIEETEQSLCPYPPPKLGLLTANYTGNVKVAFTSEYINGMHPDVRSGGHWKPRDCTARQTVAVIVPYRDRETDRSYFLPNIHTFLKAQMIEYKIYLIEQGDRKHFNRGSLFNVAYDVIKDYEYDCMIIHDIDKYPENTKNLYMCTDRPTHLFVKNRVYGDNYNRMPYDHFFGGVVAILKSQFAKVNGFSNMFWSWGNEDDNFRDRLLRKELNPTRVPENIGLYREIKSPLGFVSPKRHGLMKKAADFYDVDGLNNLEYRKLSETKHPLYTMISVELTGDDPYEGMPL